jgi:hypothetical protein
MLSVFGTSPCIISLSKRALNSFLSKRFFLFIEDSTYSLSSPWPVQWSSFQESWRNEITLEEDSDEWSTLSKKIQMNVLLWGRLSTTDEWSTLRSLVYHRWMVYSEVACLPQMILYSLR